MRAARVTYCLAVAAFTMILPTVEIYAQGSSGDRQSIVERPSLLGGPDSIKESLADRGILFDASLTQFYQGQVSGSDDNRWRYGGKGVARLTIDGSRFGLWDGFFVSLHQDVVFGRSVDEVDNGAVLFANFAWAFPDDKFSQADTSFLVSQRFGTNVSLTGGKFNGLDLAAGTPLIGGGGLNTFMRLGLATLPSGILPPYFLGGVLSVRTEPATYSLMVYDPRSAQDSDVFRHPFSDGMSFSLSATIPTTTGGLRGFHTLQGVHSTQSGLDLAEIRLPQASDTILGQKKGYWYGAYSVQQFLAQSPGNPSEGWGVFGKIAVSEGNPNPFEWEYQIGLGGSSMFEGRELDRWGVG